MTELFLMRLDRIQPSQLYVSSEKLSKVLEELDRFKPEVLEPFPVRKLGDRVVLTDGHTRALAAFLRGFVEVRVFWDEEDWDWEAYEVCVGWCVEEGVCSVGDLKGRVVSQEQFDLLWLKRCREMQQGLEAKRSVKPQDAVSQV